MSLKDISEVIQNRSNPLDTKTGHFSETPRKGRILLTDEMEIIGGSGISASISPIRHVLCEIMNSWQHFIIYLVIYVLGMAVLNYTLT